MSKRPLVMACGPYDRMSALYSGAVQVEGFELQPCVLQQPMEIFGRMLKHAEFDIAEMSFTHCLSLHALGSARFVTLPVFPSRMFRHGYIFVNRRVIQTPQDLRGKRIGVQGHQMTAAVWIRGLLREDYGVSLDDVLWFEGGVNSPGVSGGDATKLRPGKLLNLRNIGNERTLSDMLARGEIDALIGALVPDSLQTSPDVVRLFPDYPQVEREYYRRTGIFPIMHALTIRDDVHREHPQLALALYRACESAKRLALQHSRFTGSLQFMLPWLLEHLEERQQIFGDDPWPYGLGPNRATLEAFRRCLIDDGFVPATLALEEVFVPV